MIRGYVVTLETFGTLYTAGEEPERQASYLRLGTYRASSPAKARKKAADQWGFTDAETLVAVPERYWQEAVFVPERPTLGLGL